MSRITTHISISLDGFVAGPDQTVEEPIGKGGERLHAWMFATAAWARMVGQPGGEEGIDSEMVAEITGDNGAYVMGRNMFGPVRGDWPDDSWRGWWGPNPPYHAPVFVLTHHEREPLVMEGGTTFTFVTDGIESAIAQARAAAGEKDIAVAGGASTVQQAIAAGLLDELVLHVSPILLERGERLLENVGDATFTPLAAHHSPAVTHVRYGITRA
jgi:dihydrofolate reductase